MVAGREMERREGKEGERKEGRIENKDRREGRRNKLSELVYYHVMSHQCACCTYQYRLLHILLKVHVSLARHI